MIRECLSILLEFCESMIMVRLGDHKSGEIICPRSIVNNSKEAGM